MIDVIDPNLDLPRFSPATLQPPFLQLRGEQNKISLQLLAKLYAS